MIRIPERYVDTIDLRKKSYINDLIEVFVNPSPKELRDIITFPEIRFFLSKQDEIYCFDSRVLHDFVIDQLSVGYYSLGVIDFKYKIIKVYEMYPSWDKILDNTWIQKICKGFPVIPMERTKKTGDNPLVII